MSAWLEPLRARLDRPGDPVTFFFRNDDVGCADDTLLRLLELFEEEAAPLDLAVIPAALSDAAATALLDRRETAGGRLRFHQHGCRHVNHESHGRKCEFGDSRGPVEQRDDIEAGRARLADLLGGHVERIFTPPWNRCTQATVDALAALGFEALSRDATAAPLRLGALADLSIAVDWARRQHPRGDGLSGVAVRLADAVDGRAAIGVMLHHAGLDDQERRSLRELIRLLSGHPQARLAGMAAAHRYAAPVGSGP